MGPYEVLCHLGYRTLDKRIFWATLLTRPFGFIWM